MLPCLLKKDQGTECLTVIDGCNYLIAPIKELITRLATDDDLNPAFPISKDYTIIPIVWSP